MPSGERVIAFASRACAPIGLAANGVRRPEAGGERDTEGAEGRPKGRSEAEPVVARFAPANSLMDLTFCKVGLAMIHQRILVYQRAMAIASVKGLFVKLEWENEGGFYRIYRKSDCGEFVYLASKKDEYDLLRFVETF
jgi:hypothetical protein